MTKLLKFQRRGVRRLHRCNGRTLLADEMGLGKSLQSIIYAVENDEFPIVVVCPAFLKGHWEREFLIHAGIQVDVLEGRRVPKRSPLLFSKVIVVNYDILGAWLPYLRGLKPKLVIVDETQYIKNPGTKRTKYTRILCKRIKKVIGLSGTPLEIRPIELFCILHILWKKEFPAYWSYGMRYCKPRRTPWGIQFRGATRSDELHERLKSLGMIRRLKSQVMKYLPPKRNVVVPMDVPGISEYKEAEQNFKQWLIKASKSKKAARKAIKSQAIVQMGYLKRLAAKLKLEVVCQWIDNFLDTNPTEKLLVFAVHKSIMNELQERYGKQCVMVNGTTPKAKRQLHHEAFRKNPDIRIMFHQLSMSVGWSAKGCSTVGFAELGWKPGEHNQAADRVHGIGRGVKGVPSMIYYFIAKGTIEERLCGMLQHHQKVIDAILDGGPVSDYDLMDQLLKTYKRAA